MAMTMGADMEITVLREVRDKLLADNEELRRQLAEAQADRDDALRRIAELRRLHAEERRIEAESYDSLLQERDRWKMSHAGQQQNTIAFMDDLAVAEKALATIINELGVPQPGYPAPVANAAAIARAYFGERAAPELTPPVRCIRCGYNTTPPVGPCEEHSPFRGAQP